MEFSTVVHECESSGGEKFRVVEDRGVLWLQHRIPTKTPGMCYGQSIYDWDNMQVIDVRCPVCRMPIMRGE